MENLSMLPVVIKYVDSLIGVAAFISTCFVMIACRSIVKDVKDSQIRAGVEYSEDKRKREDTEKIIHARITSLEKQAPLDFQTRTECGLQHAHINKLMKDFEENQKEFSKKLEEHTTQILLEIQKHKKTDFS